MAPEPTTLQAALGCSRLRVQILRADNRRPIEKYLHIRRIRAADVDDGAISRASPYIQCVGVSSLRRIILGSSLHLCNSERPAVLKHPIRILAWRDLTRQSSDRDESGKPRNRDGRRKTTHETETPKRKTKTKHVNEYPKQALITRAETRTANATEKRKHKKLKRRRHVKH